MPVMFSGFHVVDGGLGIELITRGVEIKGDPLWSARALIDNPDDIKIIHKSFLESGANIILTASYQASIDGFCDFAKCSHSEAKSLIKKSVSLAKEARQEFCQEKQEKLPAFCNRLLIAGSIGPYGACQFDGSEYHGNYVDQMAMKKLMSWHRPRIEALIEAGVDFLAVETIPSMAEAEAILHVLREFPSVSCWVTFSCKDARHVCHGETFYEAAMKVQTYGQVWAVGINCCSPDHAEELLSSINGAIHKPVVAYPNNGDIFESRFSENRAFASYVPDWLKQGTKIVGGCCGVTPADIKDVAKVLEEWTQQ